MSIFLVLLNTFNVKKKKNISRAFTPKKLLGVMAFFYEKLITNDQKCSQILMGAVSRF